MTTAGRRFMQYEYTLRLIAEDAFGADVADSRRCRSRYRIESRVQQDASVQGREQTYVLPPLTMRVASLVPSTRDAHPRSAGADARPASRRASSAARMLRLVGD